MDEKTDWFSTALAAQPLMAILRGLGPRKTVELAENAWSLGITCLEVPVQEPRDLEALTAVIEAGARHGHTVGAGTIVSPELVRTVADAGAAFTVAPGFDAEIARASHEAGMPHLPGIATPTEIHQALTLGLHWVKAFPAAQLGPEWIKAMRGPFPDVKIVATGGMNAGNAGRYLDAGADVVAVGAALADPTEISALATLLKDRCGGKAPQ